MPNLPMPVSPVPISHRILVCEPLCWGFVHRQFNAPFLQTLLIAFPNAQIIFLAEPEHLNLVRQNLIECEPRAVNQVDFRAITIPQPAISAPKRFWLEVALFRKVIAEAIECKADMLVLCAMSGSGLLALKLAMSRSRFVGPTIVVLHSVLSTIVQRPLRKPWNWILSLPQTLRLLGNQHLKYVVLGEPIYRNVIELLPALAPHFMSMDHAYLWDAPPTESHHIQAESIHPVRFGFLGTSNENKGFKSFANLSMDVRKHHLDADFILVGFVNDVSVPDEYGNFIKGFTRKPLTPEEYRARANSLTYVLSPLNPPHYRLVTSASFLDALAYTKPGIYLRNPMIEHYFQRMGDIGYLCDSYEEMLDTVITILQKFPAERYEQQCHNILHARQIFSPEVVANQVANWVA